MPASFCTVEQSSEEAARVTGAKQLGVHPADVSVALLAEGRYRVELVRARFVIEVELVKNGMEGVVARIAPALGDAPQPTRADVLRALADAKIKAGILEPEIDRMLELVVDRKIEQRGVVVARGERPRRGEDARVTRHYDLDPAVGWTPVRDGDLLIEREPATAGEPGFTVSGEPLPAHGGDDQPVAVGPGIVSDAAGRSWRASAPGFGYLELDAIGVPAVVPAIALAPDRLSASVDLRLPVADEDALAPQELDAALAAAGVVHGLQTRRVAALRRAIREQRVPRRPVRVAIGTPARAGRDAGVAFAVPVGLNPGALDPETGRIDYRERGASSAVSKGQLVGSWLAATPGIDGVGVDGAILPATDGAAGELVLGPNALAGEPGDAAIPIFAGIDGAVVTSAPNHVDVVEVLEVPGDVDYATGNIHAHGCVQIRGTVRSGFRVDARYDVAIGDSIEDAVVEAGGTLTVGKGILGGDRGRVSAGRKLTANHAQNASIACGGDVELRGSATNSFIECGGRLTVSEGSGRLVGGRYVAMRGVRARELGSVAAVPTVVIVGMSPAIARRVQAVHEEQQRLRARGRKLQRSLGASSTGPRTLGTAQAADARKLMKAQRDLARTESALHARRRTLASSLFDGDPPVVEVLVRTHPGVEVHVVDASVRIDAARGGARYSYDSNKRSIYIETL